MQRYLYDYTLDSTHSDVAGDKDEIAAAVLAVPSVLAVASRIDGDGDLNVEILIGYLDDPYDVITVVQQILDERGHKTWARGGGQVHPDVNSFADLEAMAG